jgi:hypothetical protein
MGFGRELRVMKKKKQIDNNHTQEGIGHSHKPWGRLRANKGTGSGGNTRKHGERNGNLVIADQGQSTRHARHFDEGAQEDARPEGWIQ